MDVGILGLTETNGAFQSDCQERDVEDLFHKFGRILDVSLKRNSSDKCFAFIEFEDGRDAYDAIRGEETAGFACRSRWM